MERLRNMSEGNSSPETPVETGENLSARTENPRSSIPGMPDNPSQINPQTLERNRPLTSLDNLAPYTAVSPEQEGAALAGKPFDNVFIAPEFDPLKLDSYERKFKNRYVTYIDPETGKEVGQFLHVRRISGGVEDRGGETEPITVITPEGGKVEFQWPRSKEGKIARMREILLKVEESGAADGGLSSRQSMRELELVINALATDATKVDKRKIGLEMFQETAARLTLHASYLEFGGATDGEKIHNAVKPIQAGHLNFFFHNLEGFWKSFLTYDQNSTEYLKEARSGRSDNFDAQVREKIVRDESSFAKVTARSAQLTSQRLWQITFRAAAKDILVNKDTLAPATEEDRKKGNVEFLGNPQGGNSSAAREIQFVNWLYKQKNELKLVDEQIHLMDGVPLGAEEFFVSMPGKIETFYKELLSAHYSRGKTTPDELKDARERAEEEANAIAETLTGIKSEKKPGEKPVWPKDGIDISNFKWKAEDWDPDKASNPEEKENWRRQRETLTAIFGKVSGIDFSIYGATPFNNWSFFQVARPDVFRKALVESPAEGLIRNPTKENLFKAGGAIDTKWKEKENLLVNTINFLRRHNEKTGKTNISFNEADGVLMEALKNRFIDKSQFIETERKTFGWERIKVLGIFFNLWEFIMGTLGQAFKEALKIGK